MTTLSSDPEIAALSRFLEILASPVRREVLCLAAVEPHGVTQLARLCGVSQANMTRHIDALEAERLVKREKRVAITPISTRVTILEKRLAHAMQIIHPWGVARIEWKEEP
jgi:DNA-binding transcriptional ArsR family regulator